MITTKIVANLQDRNKYDAIPPPDVETGDLMIVVGPELRHIPVSTGSDGDVLTRDDADPFKVAWKAPTGGGGGGVGPDLTAIEALTGTGGLYRIASNSWALRTMVQPAAGLVITDADGVAGPPTFSLANDLAALEGLSSTGFGVRTATSTWDLRSLTIASGSTTYASWTNGNGVGGNPELTLFPSAIVLAGWKAPPRIDFTGRAVEWMSTVTSNPGTATRASNTVAACSLHYEETPSATYDAILPSTTSASAAGSTITLAIYALDATTKRPGALLWYSGTIAASNANVDHTVLFSSGTWTAAGAAYKDGSDRLVLTAGQAIWKGAWGSASVQWRTITETTARAIGFVTPVTTSSKFLGVDLPGLTYPTWPDPAPTGNNANSVGVIALPLRWV